ncbi:DUF2779 domain-containing protein [Mucilaginibacter aquariorum]|uniref:DUF2779 domain-containing protein n=1 Tax=Mucilaginibacter aquariorum TaxID=2967225 RepID=A0ABT1T7G8_9SPHI|nr:DUF2779 domain-containing protein [Mucilaginibacter aquariorum]MCQ6960403.1 DUF2779 domain-containing protein [Mucilaginibacter aquariorum]
MNPNRYLTKSRFKLALECPTKLFYTGNKAYSDQKLNDSFLAALAEGGYQVGELAKCYFPGGVEIRELDYATSLAKTDALLAQEEVIIYEAAFLFENLFIRADVLVKKGNRLELYEVKAKSFDQANDTLTNTKGIVSKWKPYVYDVAFQKYVIQNSKPGYDVRAYLMLADKSKRATVDGLNQLFMLSEDEKGRTLILHTGDVSSAALGERLLCAVNVDDICSKLFEDKPFEADDPKSFKQWAHFYADNYQAGNVIQGKLLGRCGKCEFQATPEEEALGLKSGYKECWQRAAGFTPDDFARPHILELWDFRKKDNYFADKKYFLVQLSRIDLEAERVKPHIEPGMSRVDRQWLQITKSAEANPEIHFDKAGLNEKFATVVYPLHFIDFETTAVAIPFNKGRRPYEQVAFQFSHHLLHEDGRVEHKDEWLDDQQGRFPNFDFIRQLKLALEGDKGSIFRYSNHENTVLNKIHEQLRLSTEADRDSLCTWIETITHSTGDSALKWKGDRDMIDLWDWVKKYYFAAECRGSNSIKQILPAILNDSDHLKTKYSQPIYGNSIPSLNFKDQTWIKLDEHGKVVNPYRQLDPVFAGVDQELLDAMILDETAEINEGGAAMMAYSRMQFTQMNDVERHQIRQSLLCYCELDTLAMVMIWEGWRAMLT